MDLKVEVFLEGEKKQVIMYSSPHLSIVSLSVVELPIFNHSQKILNRKLQK